MSGYDDFPSSPRRRLAGATRPSANPRIHAIQKPYSRPNSYAGPSTSSPHELVLSNGNGSPLVGDRNNGSPTKSSAPTTRPTLPTSQSQRAFPRSGSESSLFGSLKGLISKPLSWLATPRSTTKRDQSTWNAGLDSEDPESPSVKKLRRNSPPRHARERGTYEPTEKVKGKEREILPPLPTLSGALKKLPTSRAGSTLPHSQSMPYLDPPSSALSPPKKRGGVMTRSKGMNLAAMATEDDTGSEVEQKKEVWSPWKQQAQQQQQQDGRARTPSRRSGRPSISEARDYALPSLSPFRAPPSPSGTSGLARSATATNLRRAGSVASDISMSRQSTSNRQIKGSSSMLFGNGSGSVAGRDGDDAMSVDGTVDRERERTREGSVLDWFMRDRWSKEPGSSQHQRMGSLAPSSSMPPIRKGQLVWNSEKGFVRDSELRAAEVPPTQQNQAERILFALESMRKTPLADARKLTPSSSLPASLVGSSSRQIRRAINVPLATAQAGESARARRDKERLGGDERVSVMISPYGRRRAVDSELRERSVATDDYRQTKSPSHSRSQASDHEMSYNKTPTPEPPREPSPEPTPRRSSRLRRNEGGQDQEETPKSKRSTRGGKASVKNAAVETSEPPKETGRRRRKATAELTSPEPEGPPPMPSIPTITETAPSPSEKSSQSTYQPRSDSDQPRQQSSLRARTEKTKRAHGASAHGSRATSPNGGGRYSAKEEDLPDMEELQQTKITLPSFGGINFGNFGVPAPVAPKPNPPPPPAPSTEKTSSGPAPASSTGSSGLGVPRTGGPLSRLNSSRPRASSPLAATSVVAEPDSPETKAPTPPQSRVTPNENGFFSLSGAKAPVQPPAPASSLFAPPKPSTSDNTGGASGKPGFSFGLGKPSAPAPSTTSTSESGSGSGSGSGEVPNFFGTKSGPNSGTTTPVVAAPTPFSFANLSSKPVEQPKKDSAPPSFGRGPPATTDKPAPIGSFTFGAPKTGATGSGGADKPAPAPLGSFNFGAPKTQSTEEPAKTAPATSSPFGGFGSGKSETTTTNGGNAAPSFFGSTKPVVPEAPKNPFGSTPAASSSSTPTPFSFNAPATSAPKPAENPPPFSFSSTSKPAEAPKPAEPPKPAFSFGAPSAQPSAPAATPTPSAPFSFNSNPTTPAADNKSTGFQFGQTSTTPAGTPANGGFGFGGAQSNDASKTGGQKSAPAPAPTNGGFGFSGSNTNPSGDGKTNGTATSAPFGSSSTSAFGSTGSAFGAQNGQNGKPSTSSTSFGFGSTPAAPAPAPAASNPFGSSTQQAAPSTSFGFGSTTPAVAPAPAPAFGASNSNASPFGGAQQSSAGGAGAGGGGFNFAFGAPANNNASPGFGSSNAPPASPGFGFNTNNNAAPTTPTSAPPSGGFGFGAAAGGASTTPSQPAFTFGTPPTQNGSTTPAGQPGGAGLRFGSPAPGGTPPVDGGGFNLGMDSTAPGSPSGRKIKPLRRGAKR